jgi:hypothetical protein
MAALIWRSIARICAVASAPIWPSFVPASSRMRVIYPRQQRITGLGVGTDRNKQQQDGQKIFYGPSFRAHL